MTTEYTFQIRDLQKLTVQLLTRTGIHPKDAIIVAKVLMKADLEGNYSHGISRLPIYLERLQKGLLNKKPQITIDFPYAALGIMDADNSLGHIASYRAMGEVIKRAKYTGVAVMGVKNSNHFGVASYYTDMALQKGLVGVVISNGPPAIPPWGGREPYFGTNPLALSIPGGEQGPVSIDMATSTVARGKIIKAAQDGLPIELGWALDEEGKPTEDAQAALKGCILPLGGAKGAALALAIEVMAGVLTGAGFGKDVIWQYSNSSDPCNVGHMFLALNPNGLLTNKELGSRMDRLIIEIKGLAKAYGFEEIRIPGERKVEQANFNKTKGIKLSANLVASLGRFAKDLNISMPSFK